MTDVIQALYDKMVLVAGITTLVGTRIYLTEAPQNVATPYLVYKTVTPLRDRHLEGRSNLVRSRIQMDAYDTMIANAGQLSVVDIANAVRAGIDGFRGTVSGVDFLSVAVDGDQDLTEPGTRMARRSFDVIIWHDE